MRAGDPSHATEVAQVSTDWIVQFPRRKSIRVLQLQLQLQLQHQAGAPLRTEGAYYRDRNGSPRHDRRRIDKNRETHLHSPYP